MSAKGELEFLLRECERVSDGRARELNRLTAERDALRAKLEIAREALDRIVTEARYHGECINFALAALAKIDEVPR